jgi:uncharacterized protein (TIGR03435 family)
MKSAERIGVVAICVVAATIDLTGGQQPDADPSFDVASVKPAQQELLRQRGFECSGRSPDRFVAFGTAQWLIACAYGILQLRAPQELLGGPDWLNADLFVIEAKLAPGNALSFGPEGVVALQALLAERFQLRMHRETRQQSVYALVVGRRDGRLGAQLRPASPECAAWVASGRRGMPPPVSGDVPCGLQRQSASSLRGSGTTLARLADLLSPRAGRPVEDRTELSGLYDFALEWDVRARPLEPADPARPPTLTVSGPTLFDALQDQLGLKLDSMTGEVDVFVIDHVERPTPD